MTQLTNAFRELVSTLAEPSRGKPSQALAARRRRKADALKPLDALDIHDPAVDAWTVEARRVITSLESLEQFLRSIRRAYLDIASGRSLQYHSSGLSSSHSRGKHVFDGNVDRGHLDTSKNIFAAWANVNWLDDRERDEVDFQAKTVLKGAAQRIKELEQAEKNRHARVAAQQQSIPGSSLTRYFHLPIGVNSEMQASEEQYHAHRMAITLYMSRKLAQSSKQQKDQQEKRIQRQLEKQSMAAGAPLMFAESAASATMKQSLTKPIYGDVRPTVAANNGYEYAGEDDEPIEGLLSAEQIQQFESESSQMLQEANAQMASIEKAQSSLLEISALQNELVVQLTQQTELTDKLWEDAVFVTGRVQEGNKQLKQARERNREGRVWLLIFLVGASLSLLFLEYY